MAGRFFLVGGGGRGWERVGGKDEEEKEDEEEGEGDEDGDEGEGGEDEDKLGDVGFCNRSSTDSMHDMIASAKPWGCKPSKLAGLLALSSSDDCRTPFSLLHPFPPLLISALSCSPLFSLAHQSSLKSKKC